MRPQSGEIIQGKYRITSPIADGGMGMIFEARHELLGTSVALKFLHPELSRRQGLVARFLQEARVSATIRSPHVVQVLDVDQDPHGPFLVMELLRGETLQRLIDRQRRLEVQAAVDVAQQVLLGLEAAHGAGVVHRDLKPENVFLAAGQAWPTVKLLDFGIAKLRASHEFQQGLTRPGVTMGTPEYMAPEQAFAADTVDGRADLYALGVMLFEMIAGRRPVAGEDPREIAGKVYAGQVTALSALLPSLPIDLVAAVHRAMAPLPANRFASAREMAQALAPFGLQRTFAAPTPASTTPAPPLGAPMSSMATPHAVVVGLMTPAAPTAATGSMTAWSPSDSTTPGPSHLAPAHLSHTPPVATTPQGQPPAYPPPQAARPTSGVARTLPPEAPHATTEQALLPQGAYTPAPQHHGAWSHESKGGTHPGGAPSPDDFARHGGQSTAIAAIPFGGPVDPSGHPGATPYTPSPLAPAMPMASPPPAPVGRRARSSLGLLAALAAASGGLVVVLLLALRGRSDGDASTGDPPPSIGATDAGAAPPMTAPTVSGQGPGVFPPGNTQPPTPLPTGNTQPPRPLPTGNTQPPSQASSRPPALDGGAPTDGGPGPLGRLLDAGVPGLPSSLPAIPLPIPVPIPLPGFPDLP